MVRLFPLSSERVRSQDRSAMNSTVYPMLPRVPRGEPYPDLKSDLPSVRTHRPGGGGRLLRGKIVLERCAESSIHETPTCRLDSRWSRPGSPGFTSKHDSEPWTIHLFTGPLNIGVVFIRYLSRSYV